MVTLENGHSIELAFLGSREKDGNDPEGRFAFVAGFISAAGNGQPDLLGLPGAQSARANEHGAGLASGQASLDRIHDEVAAAHFLIVEPRFDSFLFQTTGQFVNRSVIRAAVGDEDVKGFHGNWTLLASPLLSLQRWTREDKVVFVMKSDLKPGPPSSRFSTSMSL
jgi:hypothetical protein